MRKSLLSVYLVLTFLITYGLWFGVLGLLVSGLLIESDWMTFLLYMLGGNGPFIAAMICLFIFKDDGRPGDVKNNCRRIRVNPGWYIIAVVLPFIWVITGWAFNFLFAGGDTLTAERLLLAPLLFLIMIVGGGTEEFGWRGIALPELEEHFGTVAATIIVGVIWAAWHIPLWFIPIAPQRTENFASFFVTVIALSLLFTWLFNNTKSVGVCVVFHSMANTVVAIGLADWNTTMLSEVIQLVVIVALALLIFAHWQYSQRKEGMEPALGFAPR